MSGSAAAQKRRSDRLPNRIGFRCVMINNDRSRGGAERSGGAALPGKKRAVVLALAVALLLRVFYVVLSVLRAVINVSMFASVTTVRCVAARRCEATRRYAAQRNVSNRAGERCHARDEDNRDQAADRGVNAVRIDSAVTAVAHG